LVNLFIRWKNDFENNSFELILSLGSIENIAETELFLEELNKTNLVEHLVIFIGKVGSGILREYSIRILFHISESVWTRGSIFGHFNKIYNKIQIKDLIREIKKNPSSKEESRIFQEMLMNTDISTEQYTSEPPAISWINPKQFPFLSILEENFEVIRQEALTLKNHKEKLIPWPEKFIIKEGWDILGLFAFENKFNKFCEICPQTTKMLETIPGLQTALFSCLAPRAHIKPHIGYYTYSEKILRVHLGIFVPDGSTLKVNGKDHTWEEGKLIVFDDTFRHEAWNPSYDKTRVVLMFDIACDVNITQRNPEFYEKSLKQKTLGENALISNDLLGIIANHLDSPSGPTNVQERPIEYL